MAWNKVPGSMGAAAGRLGLGFQGYAKTAFHARGMAEVSSGFGFAKNMNKFSRGLGFLSLGVSAIAGYKEGGVWGATKGVATTAAFNYGVGAVLGAASFPVLAAATAVAAGAYGTYAFQKHGSELGRSYMVNRANLELGSGYVSDQFGTVSTMRRRSIQAIQNSRINGTVGLGNEAALTYQPYWR